MKTIPEHIRYIHGKPHHIRRRVAFTAAGIGAGLLALVWVVGSLSAGTFALKPTSFADSTGAEPVTTVPESEASSGLAGAAAAPAADASAPARIEIVNVAATSSPQPQQTTIPF